MHDLPPAVTRFVERLLVDVRSPAYLLVGDDGTLRERGGELSVYGLEQLVPESGIVEQLPYLEGMVPLKPGSPSLRLSCLKTGRSCSADLHIFRDEAGTWVIYFDSASREIELFIARQRANEAALDEERRERRLTEQLGSSLESFLDARPRRTAERFERLGLLAVELRSPAFRGGGDPESALRCLDLALDILGREAAALGGYVEGPYGESLRAVFGLPPWSGDPAAAALEAARRFHDSLKKRLTEAEPGAASLPPLACGMGLAAGSLLAGTIGGPARRGFALLGDPAVRAAWLKSAARDGELLADEESLGTLAGREGFELRQLDRPESLRCFVLSFGRP